MSTAPRPPQERSADDPPPDPHDSLATTLAAVARDLYDAEDEDALFARIAELAPGLVPGADHCGITVVRRHHLARAGSSSAVAARVDALQHGAGEGPCAEAVRTHRVQIVPDATVDDRWPALMGRTVAETPVRSFLAHRLFVEDRTFGALNLYAERPDAFDERSLELAALLAAHAAIALVNLQDVHGLRHALAGRDLISTAKGILMAREGVGQQEAFEMLRAASRRSNVPLRDLAAQIVDGVVSR